MAPWRRSQASPESKTSSGFSKALRRLAVQLFDDEYPGNRIMRIWFDTEFIDDGRGRDVFSDPYGDRSRQTRD
jgi:hypothetical protein